MLDGCAARPLHVSFIRAKLAEDLAQEAFLRILSAAPRYKPSAAFSTYLYRVVGRLCIDNARKKRPILTGALPETADSSPDPATALVRKDRDALIRKALDALPSRQRMVIILKYYEGLSYGEIARAMGTTVKAVKNCSAAPRRHSKNACHAWRNKKRGFSIPRPFNK